MKKFFLLMLAAVAVDVFASDTVINVPRLEHEPELGGNINVGLWKQCARFFGFTSLRSGKASKSNTCFAIGEYNNTLYVAVRCEVPKGLSPCAQQKKNDGKIFCDDSVDMCLALPGKLPGEYYQFSLNSINTRYDAHGVDLRWNGKWTSAATHDKDGFTLFFAIPFSDLGLKGTPDELRFNLARSVIAGETDLTVWIRTGNNAYFANAQKGALLKFGEGMPVLSVEKGEESDGGKLIFKIFTPVIPEVGFVDSVIRIFNEKGKIVEQKMHQTRFDSKMGTIVFESIPDGNYTLQVSLEKSRVRHIPAYYGGGGEELTDEAREGRFKPITYVIHSWPLTVNNKSEIQLKVSLKRSGRELVCNYSPKNIVFTPGLHYRFSILDANRKHIRNLGMKACDPGEGVFRCDLGDLPERTRLILHCGLFSGEKQILEQECRFATPPAPGWLKSNPDDPEGKVLAPWTPVRLEKLTVSVWGRDYVFSETSPAPVQIISQNIKLLASPARFITGKTEVLWKLTRKEKRNDSTVRFEWIGCLKNGELKASAEVYFDGVIRIEITVPPGLDLTELALELPYRKDLATFIHRAPVMFGGIFTTYPVPLQPEYHPIRENVFILNDDVGLCWFDGMRFDWPLKEPLKAVSLIPGPNEFTLRIQYIDTPGKSRITRDFSLGLQAIPARPMPEREPAMRVCYVVKYGDEDAKKAPAWLGTVDYLPKGNFDEKQGTIEFQIKPDFEPSKQEKNEYFFRAPHGDYYSLNIGWTLRDGIYADIYEYGTKVRLNSKINPERNRWTHVALSWGDSFILYVNGKAVAQAPFKNSLKVFPAMLKVGGKNVFLDALRISNIPRSEFKTDVPPCSDEHTLLLDNFDAVAVVNGRRATLPEKIDADAECGYLMPDTELGEGRFRQGVQPLKSRLKSRIEGYAELGIDTMIYHASQYTDEAFAGLYIQDEPKFKKNLAAIKKNGMRALIYVNNGISTLDCLWDTYSDPWLITPRGLPFVTPTRPDDKGYQACPRSDYFKYFVHRIGVLLDTYKLDGFFLDGRMYATCGNALHGCGVRNFEGKIVPGRDIWDGRRKQLFLYNVSKSRNCYAEEHKSGNWDAPICFLWDGAWEGEQFMSTIRGKQKRLDLCPLTAMRAQMNGLPYGIPTRFTAYAYFPFTPVENATLSFVHGTTSSMTYRLDEAHVQTPYWRAQDKFGATYKNFIPYWAKEPPVISTPDALVKVSANRKKDAILLIIANFNEDKPFVSGKIKLNPAVVKFKNPVAYDAFSGTPVKISPEGSFELEKLKSFRQAWIIIEEKK